MGGGKPAQVHSGIMVLVPYTRYRTKGLLRYIPRNSTCRRTSVSRFLLSMPVSLPATPATPSEDTASGQTRPTRLAPNRDPKCDACRNPNRSPCLVDPADRTWKVGDIVMLAESIHLPVEAIFAASNTDKLSRPSAALSAKGSISDLKRRSAVV